MVSGHSWEDGSRYYLGNPPLHDDKIGVVDIELNTLKHGLDRVHLALVAIEKVFGHVG